MKITKFTNTLDRFLKNLNRLLRTFQKNCIICFICFFKNDEKCFLFHLKSSFRSQDI